MASGNDQTIHGIFADNDSVNEDEFEGFGPDDIYIDLNNENSRTDLFDSEKWGVGNRQDQEPLLFPQILEKEFHYQKPQQFLIILAYL